MAMWDLWQLPHNDQSHCSLTSRQQTSLWGLHLRNCSSGPNNRPQCDPRETEKGLQSGAGRNYGDPSCGCPFGMISLPWGKLEGSNFLPRWNIKKKKKKNLEKHSHFHNNPKSLDPLAGVAFDKSRALDYLLANQGGVCTVINKTCCMYINISGGRDINVKEIYLQTGCLAPQV